MGTLQHTIYPKIQDKTVYEYALPTSGQYVSDLKLHCHPLIIDRTMLNEIFYRYFKIRFL